MDDSYNSYSRKQLDDLFLKMIAYYGGDPKRIQHFVKVHSFARIIAVGEQMDEGMVDDVKTGKAGIGTHEMLPQSCWPPSGRTGRGRSVGRAGALREALRQN